MEQINRPAGLSRAPHAIPALQPIAPEHVQAIAQARRQARKINRAASVAAFSGWTMAVFAIFSLLGGVFSLPTLLLGLGMSWSARVELRASAALRRFDITAPRRLALNQAALFIMFSMYAGWSIVQALTGPSPYADYLKAGDDVARTIAPIARLHVAVTIGFYAAVIVISAIAQGAAACYYLTRRGHVCAYLANTPPWIVQTLRAAA